MFTWASGIFFSQDTVDPCQRSLAATGLSHGLIQVKVTQDAGVWAGAIRDTLPPKHFLQMQVKVVCRAWWDAERPTAFTVLRVEPPYNPQG